jgi:hypothetical protein
VQAALKGIGDEAMVRVRRVLESENYMSQLTLFGLSPNQVLLLKEHYTKTTGQPAESIGKNERGKT